MPAMIKNETLKLSNSPMFQRLEHGEKKVIKKNRESKKCPLCFEKRPCGHGKKITNKLGLKAAFIGSYNKQIQSIVVPSVKRESFNNFIVDLMDKFENSLPTEKVESKEQKDRYREKLIKEFYGKIIQEAKKRDFEVNNIESLPESTEGCASDEESVDLSSQGSEEEDEEEFETVTQPCRMQYCITTPPIRESTAPEAPKKSTIISVGVGLENRGYFVKIDSSDCENVQRFKQAVAKGVLHGFSEQMFFKHPETKLNYEVNTTTLEIIQGLLNNVSLLEFNCK